MDLLGEEAVGFPFPGKVRLGSVHMGLVDLLGNEAVGFPFLDSVQVTKLCDEVFLSIVYSRWGKVRLG